MKKQGGRTGGLQNFRKNIGEISRRLQAKYPEFKDTIDLLFLNATQGNPAIPSDVYRLIGALGAYDRAPQKYHVVYCNVDTLALEIGRENTEALFKVLWGTKGKRPGLRIKRVFAMEIFLSPLLKRTYPSMRMLAKHFFRDGEKMTESNFLITL